MTKGYKNECDFEKTINNKKYCDLCDNLKGFIKFIFNDVKEEDVLKCRRYKSYDKADIYIELNNNIKNISIKSGERVSVHAEMISSFTNFLEKIHFRKSIIDSLLLYHYGDFTLDGSGKTRISARELKEKYKKELIIMNNYFNHKNIIKKVALRCLFEGVNKNNVADYIYYGNVHDGLYASKEEIIDYFCNTKSDDIIAPHFSFLVYQNWDRNIIYNPKIESHRYYCQFKWPSISRDLLKIREK